MKIKTLSFFLVLFSLVLVSCSSDDSSSSGGGQDQQLQDSNGKKTVQQLQKTQQLLPIFRLVHFLPRTEVMQQFLKLI